MKSIESSPKFTELVSIAVRLYPCIRFESRAKYRLLWLSIFVVSFRSLTNIGIVPRLRHDHFFPILRLVNHHIIYRYRVYMLKDPKKQTKKS
jgi:hypothetical protein